ncbi:MAG TPA: hypothetical protein VNO23_17270 [Candidatus Binatia bacterium]|nr:hypothetical protein [Candidatus Binatia bacterium]
MRRVLIAVLLGLAAALPVPASAESEAFLGPRSVDLEVSLRLRPDGFRLGGTLAGPTGTWGAWLNGLARRDGFTLDGRVEEPGRALEFRLDAELRRWLSL